MKNIIHILLICTLSASLFFTSCSTSDKEVFSFVPETTLGLVSFNPGALLEKGKIQQMEFIKRHFNDEEFLSKLIENPDASGIKTDAYSTFFVFGKAPKLGCVVMPVRSKSELEDFIKDFAEEYEIEFSSENHNGFTFIQHDKVLIGYDKNKAFVLSSFGMNPTELSDAALILINTEKEFSLLTDKDFNNFLDKQKDINVWFSTTNLQDMPGMNGMGGISDMIPGIKNNYAHIFLEFQKGAVVSTTNLVLNKEMKQTVDQYNFFDTKASKEILRYLPGDDLIFVGNTHVNPEKIFKLLKITPLPVDRHLRDLENQLDLKEGQLEEIFTGEIAFSVNGISEIERENEHHEELSYLEKIPVFTGVARLKHKVAYDEMIKYIGNHAKVTEKSGYHAIEMHNNIVFITLEGNYIVASNAEANIQQIAEKGDLNNSVLKADFAEILTGNPVCFFLNLNRDSYTEEMKEYITEELPEEYAMGIESFGDKLKSLSVSGGLEDTEFRMTFKDDEEYSLYTILSQIDRL